MPTISVIVPTHNRPHFLHQAIKSILAQSFADLEAIVVDDGSEDDTRNTVLSFHDSRIRYIYQEKGGRSVARNRGLIQSQGDYVAFLDDDDLFFSHKIDSQLRFLHDNPKIDLVNSGVWYIDSQNSFLGIYAPWLYEQSISFHSALYSTRMTTHSVLFRRSVLESLDQWFDPELDLCEDADFLIRILQNGCRAGMLRGFVGAYRIHSSNSASGGVEYARSYRKVLDRVFLSRDLPPSVLEDRKKVYAHFLVVAACRAYAARDASTAREYLEEATEKEPALVEERITEIMARFAGFAGSDPRPFVEFALANLPDSLAHYHYFKREIFKKVLENQLVMERELQVFTKTAVGKSLLREFPKVNGRQAKTIGGPNVLAHNAYRLPDSAVGATE